MAVEEEEAQTEVVTAVGSGILERGDKSWDADRAAVLSLRTLVKGQSFSEMQKSDAACSGVTHRVLLIKIAELSQEIILP